MYVTEFVEPVEDSTAEYCWRESADGRLIGVGAHGDPDD